MASRVPSAAQVLRSLLAYLRETVEFTVPDAPEERTPFAWRKTEDRAVGIPAVADADFAVGQARDLDAVTVGVTEGTLHPVRT
jgi:hypothetical protein